MAYTSVIPVRRLNRAMDYVQNKEKTTEKSLEDAIDYALNREKTEQTCFETGLACTTATAFADMKACKQRWHKPGGVQGFHLVQSFKAGEVTPELAHKIGVELAEQLLGGRYQAIVTTHLNTAHCHNHIVWNSVALDNGKKYHSNAKTYVTEVRAISDALCEKYGLSVIHSDRADAVSQPYQDWLADKEGRPIWRTAIRQDVDEAVSQSFTWRQFVHTLEGRGCELRMNRTHPTLRPSGMERCVRFKTLGNCFGEIARAKGTGAFPPDGDRLLGQLRDILSEKQQISELENETAEVTAFGGTILLFYYLDSHTLLELVEQPNGGGYDSFVFISSEKHGNNLDKTAEQMKTVLDEWVNHTTLPHGCITAADSPNEMDICRYQPLDTAISFIYTGLRFPESIVC